MQEHIKVYTGSSIEVNRIVAIFEEQKISFIIKDHLESGRLAGFGTSGESVDVYISNADKEKVEKVFEGL